MKSLQKKHGRTKAITKNNRTNPKTLTRKGQFNQYLELTTDKLIKTSPLIFLIFSLLAFSLTIPISRTSKQSEIVRYETEHNQSSDLESGESELIQTGKNGRIDTTYIYSQSTLSNLLGMEANKIEDKSKRQETKPINEILKIGTKRWQYMHCQNGQYRYYTDQQMASPSSGFTSKSRDECENNGMGKKLRLSDSPTTGEYGPQPQNPTTDYSHLLEDLSLNCQTTSIPHQVSNLDADWLYEGNTRHEGLGLDGTKLSCDDGFVHIIEPFHQTIYRGTKKYETYVEDEPIKQEPNYAAKGTCDNNYSSALAQLRASGVAGDPSATQRLQSIHSQCLRSAGF